VKGVQLFSSQNDLTGIYICMIDECMESVISNMIVKIKIEGSGDDIMRDDLGLKTMI
jgi:hypothetical protein